MHRRRRGISGQNSSTQPSTPLPERTVDDQSQPSPPQVEGHENGPSLSGRKRGRGPTRGLSILTMRPGERLAVMFNEYGQPIGKNASKFANLCGGIVKNPYFAPLQLEKWAEISEHSKEMMWRHIQEHTDVGDERRKWVMQSLDKKYMDYRNKMKKKFYCKWETDEDRLGHPPSELSIPDWTWLVKYWSSPKAQAIAARNKANCSHRKMRHTGGTKSFACHRDEETRSRTDGSIPSRVDMYFRTHLRKDGTPVDNFSGEIISKFRELAALSSQDGSSSFVGDDIYTQVMGPERHGRVRGYGLGPTPTSVFGSTSSQSRGQYEEMRARLDEQMEGLKTKHSKELQMQQEVIQRQREEMQQEMQREMQRMQEEMQKKQDEMMEVVRQIMSNQL